MGTVTLTANVTLTMSDVDTFNTILARVNSYDPQQGDPTVHNISSDEATLTVSYTETAVNSA